MASRGRAAAGSLSNFAAVCTNIWENNRKEKAGKKETKSGKTCYQKKNNSEEERVSLCVLI